MFDPSKVSREINTQYHLNVTADVVEELAHLFEEKGWLTRILDADHIAFRVDCPPDEHMLSASAEFEQKAREISVEFRSFIDGLSPLSSINRQGNELVEDLVNWLIALDVYSEEDLKVVRQVQTLGKKLVYETVTAEERHASDENYLAARFVDHLLVSNSNFVPFLIELASVGLITDVVRDFQKPTSSKTATDLIVYLDAPVALDFLGLSGKITQQNIAMILNKITAMGGSIRVFRVSVEEMQNSLNAMLSRPAFERDGATAQALRNREVLEAFVRQVATNPDGVLKSFGVTILDQDERLFPNEHKYFTKGDIQELYSKVHWVQDDIPRYHDALVAGLTLRKRAGTRSNDLFELKHVVITRNPYFSPVARRLAAEKGYIGPNHYGPVVHQRQFATSVWLRAGLAASDNEVPRKYILAACQRVLAVHKKMIDRVRFEARNLSDQAKEQLELLLSEGRSTQALMDKTLGSPSVIDSTNIERLVDAMKRSLAAEAHAEADEKVRVAQDQAKVAKRELTSQLRKADDQATALRSGLVQQEDMNRRIVDAVVLGVNRSISRRRRFATVIGFVALLLFEALPFGLGWLQGAGALLGTGFLYALTILAHFTGQLKKVTVDPILKRLDQRTLRKGLEHVGLGEDGPGWVASYEGDKFIVEWAANDALTAHGSDSGTA